MNDYFLEQIREEKKRGDLYFEHRLVLSKVEGRLEHVIGSIGSKYYSKEVVSFSKELLDFIHAEIEVVEQTYEKLSSTVEEGVTDVI